MAVSRERSDAPLKSDESVLGLIDVTARWRYRLLRIVLIPIVRLLFRIEIRGRINIPAQGGYIVVANHHNWLDAPLILMAFPITPRINFVADSTFVTESRLSWFVIRQVGGVLPLIAHGHGAAAFSHVVRTCLARGGVVGFFPEGRYDDTETKLLRLHRGFAKAAIEAGACVVPVTISGTKELWFRKRVVVVINEPIHPEGHSLETLAVATSGRIEAARPAAVEPRGPRLLRRWLSGLYP
ncbi:MAG: lysophospholipid acyltransferase family protein [Candidatus Limnocylindria bacterium]